MYYYVYRITNKHTNMHYYGVRSSKQHPKRDLGISYFSSSTDIHFLQDQQQHPEWFKYKVIKVCASRIEALSLEVKLHHKFDVSNNPQFYNKVKQTTTKFDVTGQSFNKDTVVAVCTLTGIRKRVSISEFKESDSLQGVAKGYFKNTIVVQTEDNVYKRVPKNHPNVIDGTWKHAAVGTIRSTEAINKQRLKVLGIKRTDEQKEHLRCLMTEERKQTLSKQNKGKHPPVTKYYKITLATGQILTGTQIEVATAMQMCPKTLRKFTSQILLSDYAKKHRQGKIDVDKALIEILNQID